MAQIAAEQQFLQKQALNRQIEAASAEQPTPPVRSIGRGKALEILVAAKNRPGAQQVFANCTFTTHNTSRIGVLQEYTPAISDPFTSPAGVDQIRRSEQLAGAEFIAPQIVARSSTGVCTNDLPVHTSTAAVHASASKQFHTATHSLHRAPGSSL